MLNNNLYFLAIVPPVYLSKDIVDIQKDFSERFNSSRSLKVMPHITVKAPFKHPAIEHNEVLKWYSQLSITCTKFFLELNGFGRFINSDHPVVYIKPVHNISLMALQKMVLEQFINRFPESPIHFVEKNYNPHLTVAYRDLKPDYFLKAWEEYEQREFVASFEVSNLYLYKHDGKRWNEVSCCNLN